MTRPAALLGVLVVVTGCGSSLSGGGSGGASGSGGALAGSDGQSGGSGGGGSTGAGGSMGGASGQGGSGSGGHGGGGAAGQGGISCGGGVPCGAGQVCVRPNCAGGVQLCDRLPDGGQCPSGWTYTPNCASGVGPGCLPPPCTPPPPFCADVPAACGGIPTCACLPSTICVQNGGTGSCQFASSTLIMCGSA